MNGWLTTFSADDHAHGDSEPDDDIGDSINTFDVGEMIPYVDTILREDDKVAAVELSVKTQDTD